MSDNEDKAVTENGKNENQEAGSHSSMNGPTQKDASNEPKIQNGNHDKLNKNAPVPKHAEDDADLDNVNQDADPEHDEELQIISLSDDDQPEEGQVDEKPKVKTVILTPSEELTPGVKKRKTSEQAEVPEDKPDIEPASPTRKVLKIETQKIPDQFDRLTPHKPDTAIISARNLLRKKIETGNLSGVSNPTDNREIILVIRGMVERLVLRDNKRVVLGRTDIKSRAVPDIDLTPYGALDRGVSREHATLHIEGDHLYVTDLDSTNGTYLAGKRITPYVPSILRKGDELLLGRLPVQVLFR